MKRIHGFTIVEMAIVLLITGLLLGGLMMGLSAQVEQRRFSDTQKGLSEIKEALLGYAIQHRYLPCPDKTGAAGPGTANDGLEDVTPALLCVASEGNIPWATLGIAEIDAWKNRYHYKVTPTYSSHAVPFKISDAGTMSVCQTAPGGLCTTPLAVNVPVVILSFGPNGKGATSNTGVIIPGPAGPAPVAPATNADEYENTDLDNIFVSRVRSVMGGTLGEFDDQVDWLPSAVLVNRMTAAGVPPGP